MSALLGRAAAGVAVACRTVVSRIERPYSRLYLLGDNVAWVLTEEATTLRAVARRAGVAATVVASGSPRGVRRQALFFTSQHALLGPGLGGAAGNRPGLAYFHGVPDAANPEFGAMLAAFRRQHEVLWRVQVSCLRMRDLLLEAGIASEKLHLIPIGVDVDRFTPATPESRVSLRARLGIPADALVVGSFQKDGNGWGEGLTPKLIKGPDVLVRVLTRLRDDVGGVHALLSGPARGYVKRGLADAGVPFTHHYVPTAGGVADLYRAADLVLVTSREEGGPKAVLESMATEVPLVSTRVGQAADLVRHGENGWLVDVDDEDALVHHAAGALRAGAAELRPVLAAARRTAEANSYVSQVPLWAAMFRGWVG